MDSQCEPLRKNNLSLKNENNITWICYVHFTILKKTYKLLLSTLTQSAEWSLPVKM